MINDQLVYETQKALSTLDPGHLPFEIFTQVCRLTVTPVLEVVCLRRNKNGTEVALLQRPKNDIHWPGMYHVPGTIITPDDAAKGFDGVLRRLCSDKLNLQCKIEPSFVSNELCLVKRGAELAVVYTVEIENEIEGGEFYDISALPSELIEGHEGFIRRAAQHLYGEEYLIASKI